MGLSARSSPRVGLAAVAALGFVVATACDGPDALGVASRGVEPDPVGPGAAADGGTSALDPAAPCGPDSCSGHGTCADGEAGARCTCDEGFDGVGCAAKSAAYGRRVKVAENLADPDVLALPDGRLLLSGTGSTVDFAFLASSDLETWTKVATYKPSEKDPQADYCFLWAPDLVQDGEGLAFYFSAHRVAKGSACPPPAGADVTTYRARSATLDPAGLGKPEALFAGTTGPRTYTAAGCPPEGCTRAIRIDAAVSGGRLYYVYFDRGNNVASLPFANPGDVLLHTGPAAFPAQLQAFEENVNEAPDLYQRGGRTYFFFSTADFRSQYATHYVVGTSPEELTRRRSLRRLTTPVRRKGGQLLETHGHNSVGTWRGEAFNFFHMGVFDAQGNLVRRDTWRQRIAFADDGRALSQNAVRLSWSGLGPNHAYSVDAVLRDGTTVGPCLGAATLGSATAVTFTGACLDAADRVVHKADVAAFRVFAADGGNFALAGEAAFDGYSDRLHVPLAGGATRNVGLEWNELETGTTYSLDVRVGGEWIAPCVGDATLGNQLAWELDGRCLTAGRAVDVPSVQALRLCSALNGDWKNARCKEVAYDGKSPSARFTLP